MQSSETEKNTSDASAEVAYYTPYYRHKKGFFQLIFIIIKNLYESRELVWVLFKRDYQGQFRKSFIGYGWVLLNPLVSILTWILLQQTGVLNPGDVGGSYPVYLLMGNFMWQLFLGFYNSATKTLGAGSSFISQVKYPHEALLFKTTLTFLVNHFIGFAFVVFAMLLLGVAPSWKIVFLPFVILPLFFLGAGIGLIVSLINVVAVDISKVINVGIQFLMYATPIVYSSKVESSFLQIVNTWNPLTYLICSARDIVIHGNLYEAELFLYVSLGTLGVFLLALRTFYLSEDKIVERML